MPFTRSAYTPLYDSSRFLKSVCSVVVSGTSVVTAAVVSAMTGSVGEISDVGTLLKSMRELGAEIKAINKNTVEINPAHANSFVVTKEMAEGMRASS